MCACTFSKKLTSYTPMFSLLRFLLALVNPLRLSQKCLGCGNFDSQIISPRTSDVCRTCFLITCRNSEQVIHSTLTLQLGCFLKSMRLNFSWIFLAQALTYVAEDAALVVINIDNVNLQQINMPHQLLLCVCTR